MILIIDDEKARMQINQQYLEKLGYKVLLFDSIKEAREFVKLKYNIIDAIILDMMMPTDGIYSKEETDVGLLTGSVFYRSFRKENGNEKLVIIYTALNRPELLAQLNKEKNCIVLKKNQSIFEVVKELKKNNVFPQQTI